MRPTGPLLLMTGLQGLAGGVFFVLAALSWVAGTPFLHGAAPGLLALLGLLLVGGGGLASTFHMHRRAAAKLILRRLTSSWLSREVATTVPFGAAAALSVLGSLVHPAGLGWERALFTVTALAGLLAMWVTAMIYATIPAMISWRTPMTVAAMMGTGLVAGGVWAWALLVASSGAAETGVAIALVWALLGLAVLKWAQWGVFRRARARVESGQAMGIPGRQYRLADSGTSRTPYRTQPQVWRPLTADERERARGPLVLATVLTAALLMASGSSPVAILGGVTAAAGVYYERWLFFADATHSSSIWLTSGAASPWEPTRTPAP